MQIDGTWLDLPGTDFLARFVLLGLALTIGWWIARWAAARSDRSADLPRLDLYETAVLVGGRARLTPTAVSQLVETGHVTVDDDKPTARDDVSVPENTIEASVFGALRAGASRAELDAVLRASAVDIEESLRAKGYVLGGGRLLGLRLVGWLLFLAWSGFGVAKMMVGLDRNRPVGFLVLLLIVGLVVALVSLSQRVRSGCTDRGVAQAQEAFAGTAMLVAVGGIAAADPLRNYFHPAATGADGGFGADGGGGDGGGGCGGGCGGCGGG
ncbi:MAG: TIGR04222 domain-containing membrane protein [Acidobacteriota bacterium]